MGDEFLPADYVAPKTANDYLKIGEGETHRIRIMGTHKDEASFIRGWEAWDVDNHPHREKYVQGQPASEALKQIDRDGKAKHFWMFIVWHEEHQKPMVYEVTQVTVRDQILSYTSNSKWGAPSNYVLAISRTGTGMETVYRVIAEPPVSPPDKDITDAIKDSMIDLRVIFEEGNPFGALGFMPATAPPEGLEVIDNILEKVVNLEQNDQEQIKRIKDDIPFKDDSPGSVGSIARDAIQTLKAAKDKADEIAPEIPGGKLY